MGFITKYEWAENVRFIATLAVVLLHVSSSAIYQQNEISLTDWSIANIINSATRCCVPLFFMLSGSLNLSKQTSYIHFLKTRMSRVVYPFLFWSFLFGLVYFAIYTLKKTDFSYFELFQNFFFYKGSYRFLSYHLWFVYVLIAIYIFNVPIQKLLENFKFNYIKYFIVSWLSILFINMFPFFENGGLTFYVFRFFGYLGYYILGFLVVKFNFSFFKMKNLLLINLILIAITALLTHYFSFERKHFVDSFYNFPTINVALFSYFMFMLIMKLDIKNKVIIKCRNGVNKYGFGIYLVHAPILFIFEKLKFNWQFIHPLIGIPLVTFVCLIISLLIINLLRRVAIFNRLVG